MSWTAVRAFPPRSASASSKPSTRVKLRRVGTSRAPASAYRWSRSSSTPMAAASRSSNRRAAVRTSAFAFPCAPPAPPSRAKKLMPHKGNRVAACGLLLLWVAGCGTMGASKTPAPVVPERPQQDISPVAPLLEMMSNLPQGDPARQAEIFQQAKDAAELQPTTSNRLRYALALATPGYSGADAVAAQRQLAELLARPETLLPVERLLAAVELKEVEQRLILQAENTRMRDAVPNDSHDKLQAANRRLAAESDENAKLRKALDEARAKLEAVTHIEQRSVTDRGSGAPHTP